MPKQPGKLRDFLIVRKLVSHKNNCYSSFDELNSKADTKLRDIFISKNEKMSLNAEQKKSASKIACIFLQYHKTPNIHLPFPQRKAKQTEMNNWIKSLESSETVISIGIKLGRYFLLNILLEVRRLQKDLLKPNYSLSNDYIVGTTIGAGAGSISFRLKFNSKFEWILEYSVVVQTQSTADGYIFLSKWSEEGNLPADVVLTFCKKHKVRISRLGPERLALKTEIVRAYNTEISEQDKLAVKLAKLI